jgi:LysM repeat protein
MLKGWLLLVFPLLTVILFTTAAGAAFAGNPHAPAYDAKPVGTDSAYIVKTNDTLWDIAVKHNTSVEALVAANRGVNPKRLVAGQKLRIPGAAGDSAPPPAAATYTVRANDTLWDIALRHDVFVNDLMAANPGVDPKRLIAGQNLVIPGAGVSILPAPAREVSAIYSVRADDTLWDIASNYGLSVNELLEGNPGVDPRRLMVGQQLLIPGITQAVLSAIVETAPPPAPDAAPAAQPPPPTAIAEVQGLTPELAAWAQEMLNRINEKRVAGGAAALTWNNELSTAAQLHAEDCARRNRGSHTGSDGSKLRTRLERVNYPAQWAGENWANSRSVGHAFDMWWNEPPGADPHVQNIMANRATEIGIGVARGAWGYYFIADFGSR